VTRLAVLAVLVLAALALAGSPPCPTLGEPAVSTMTVGPGRSITIYYSIVHWGIPKLGNWSAVPIRDTLTVVGDPRPSDGWWYISIKVRYPTSYKVYIYTYTINCSGHIRTWTKAVLGEVNYAERTVEANYLPIDPYESGEVGVDNVAPPMGEVVTADEVESPDSPSSGIRIEYKVYGPYQRLSGLNASSWNRGKMAFSYVPGDLQLVVLSSSVKGHPPAAETFAVGGGRCHAGAPTVGDSGTGVGATCNSYGTVSVKLTVGPKVWVTHTLRLWTFAGIAGYLENFLYVIDTKNNYVALYQNNKGYVQYPCKPPFNATRVAYVRNPPKGRMEALSAALWDKIGRPQTHPGTTWSVLMTYGKIEKVDVCFSNSTVEAGVVYVWRYSPDLPGGAWIELDGARGEANGTKELRPAIYVWLPRGGIYNGNVSVGGEFTGLDGETRQIDFSGPAGWREGKSYAATSGVPNVPCPPPAQYVGSDGTTYCWMTYDMAWDERWIELGTNYYGGSRVLWHWEYPHYGGGTELYWVGWHSRAIIRGDEEDGIWSISYISMHSGWGPLAWLTTPPMPDSQTSLEGEVSFTFQKNYDVRNDVNRYYRCRANDHSGSPPVTYDDTCGNVFINADVALAFGAQPAFLPFVNQTKPPPEPPDGDDDNDCDDPCECGDCGRPDPPLGDCVTVQTALASVAQGAYAFVPIVYATAPFHVVWPGAPFVLVVGMPYSTSCPSSLTATIRVYAHHMRTGFTGFINTTVALRQGQRYYVSPSGVRPYAPAACGQFTYTGLDDWYNAPQKPGIYTIVVEYGDKKQYFHYEVRPVELVWRSYTPIYTSINVPTGVVVAWMRYVNTTVMAQWWPYGAGRGGLASPYGCGAMYWSENLPGEFAFTAHFGDLAKAEVKYVDLTPKVKYLPGKGVELSIDATKPPNVSYFAVGWYVYVNRGGAWRLVGYVANNSTRLFIPQADVPVWPWDPVMIVPLVRARGEGSPIYHYKPGYVLFFNFWSLPLTNPPAQSDPAALVRLLGGVVVGP